MRDQGPLMQRVVVIGTSGSGKTTLATAIAKRLELPHVELDAVFHQPGWVPLPTEKFRARTYALLDDHRGWIVDGNYAAVRESLQRRADTIIWLDLPRRVVMLRILRRTLDRTLFRRPLWNGNRERLRDIVRWDPERNIIRWSWTTFHKNRARYEALLADGSWSHARVHRLTSSAAVVRFRRGDQGV